MIYFLVRPQKPKKRIFEGRLSDAFSGKDEMMARLIINTLSLFELILSIHLAALEPQILFPYTNSPTYGS